MPPSAAGRLAAALACLVAVAPAAAGGVATAASPAPRVGKCAPGLGIGLAEVPRGSRDPRAQTYVIDHVAPGTTFTRKVQVCNGTSAALRIALYPGAAVVRGGSFTVLEGRPRTELVDWMTVEPDAVQLASGARAIATVTFRVPRDAEPGERYGVVLAELPAASRGDGVKVASRVGVRVYLDVRTGDAARSDFVVERLQALRRGDGRPLVRAQVRNTGARALDMRGELVLADGPGGLRAGPFPATVGTTLAPGDVAPVEVLLDPAVRGGPWRAVVTMRSGLLERRAEAQLTFPEAAGAAGPEVAAEEVPLGKDRGVLIPLALGLIVALVLALLLLARRARRAAAAADPGPAAVRE